MEMTRIESELKSSARLRAFLQGLAASERAAFLQTLKPTEIRYLLYDWPMWARAKQMPPPGDWRVWLLMAGRGFGKTRAGAEWVRWLATHCRHRGHIALVGDTFDDVRHVMVEGPSGILAVSPPRRRPQWYRSQRRLIWPNGVVASCFSASDPEQLRGPEFSFAWADEIGKWPYEAAWDNLMLALRAGERPRCLATTTPRPKSWLAALAKAPDTALVQGSTVENQANLAPDFVTAMHARFGGQAIARQELDGVLLDEVPGALWSRALIAACRRPPPERRDLLRVLVGVDPALGGPGETGIIVVGKCRDGQIWVLEDASCDGAPDMWAAAVRQSFTKWRAEAVIAEVNQGGNLIRTLLTQAGTPLPLREVRAMRAKSIRAEPVAAAYARQQVFHAGSFDRLEDQMCSCVTGVRQRPSPDRLDALVWGINALLTGLETEFSELQL